MQEIVVIDGEIELENTLDGEVELEAITDLDPEVVLNTGGSVYPHYDGSYTVTPSESVQTLDTSDKVMDDDVTVQAVPQGSATTPATIITADPTISVSNGGLITAQVSKTQQVTPTVQEGYVEEGTPGNVGVSGSNTQQLTTQGAQTIHPASTDQSIASGKYLTGAQTFKAVTVSGLTADKVLQGNTIKIGDADDDDRIMSVTGTAQGGITPTGTKQIAVSANGTVTEDVTDYASAEITTNVPASAVDTGTKSISSNGTHDVVGYANASVNVPNSYSQSDEGKVVSNGALVSQTSDTVTANDTYDTTLIDELTVSVPTGGGGKTLPSGYTSCNYIQNSGDAYIDTGVREIYYAISGYEGRFAVYIGANSAKTLWGFQGSSVAAYRFTPQVNTDNTLKYYGAQSGISDAVSGWNASGINDVKVNCYASGTKYPEFNVNGTSTTGNKQNTTSGNPTQPNIYLMCSNYQGTGPLAGDIAVDGSYVRCYGFKIFSFDGAIRDFVPCVRNADSVAGFYDYVTEAFYPSIGGNAFTYG